MQSYIGFVNINLSVLDSNLMDIDIKPKADHYRRYAVPAESVHFIYLGGFPLINVNRSKDMFSKLLKFFFPHSPAYLHHHKSNTGFLFSRSDLG